MARPEVSEAAERLYASLGPFAAFDSDENDWALLRLCDGLLAGPAEQIDGYVSDTDDGPGWQALFDPDEAPPEVLPYLAQFVGARLTADMSVAEQRAAIKLPASWRRGTPAALEEAIKRTLTGSKTVLIAERPADQAYQLHIRTFTSETPSEAATLTAILTQKPIGIVLDFDAVDGQSWDDLEASATDWDDVESTYDDWNDVRSTLP